MGKSNLRKSNHIMKKTLTAVAVLGALSGATLAADVTLYGVIDTGFTYQHTEGGDDSFAMTSGSYAGPRFGFKGTEALGDNLTLGFILEAGFNSDTGVQGEDGKIFNRESQVSLSGDWGTLGFGRVGGFSSGMSSLSWYWDFEPFETGYVDAGIQASQVNVTAIRSTTFRLRMQALSSAYSIHSPMKRIRKTLAGSITASGLTSHCAGTASTRR